MFLAQHTSLHQSPGAGGAQSHHERYADGADSGTNAARGDPDETPNNLLSIRRVKPESVTRLRMVRSLGQKLRHFADALYKAASSTGRAWQMLPITSLDAV